MEIIVTNKIEKKSALNNKELQSVAQNVMTGGSSVDFDTPVDYPAVTLTNDFSVKEIQSFEFVLKKDNVFNENILDLINANVNEVCLVDIFCFLTDTEDQKPIPVRFDLSITDATNTIAMGKFSQVSFNNIKDSAIIAITVSGIVLPVDKEALLVVSLATFNDNL